ncbi:MAG: EamA/RhaT family transporter, partial [Kordiimonadaceae bacterium]|nr:EamA/RhaT family transporter [Kordiimonadaceae bacterium]
IVQLSVPAIAAFGGVVFLGEEIQTRLIIATIVIFSGIIIKVKSQII